MDCKELFTQAVHLATIEVNKITPGDMAKPTPDTEWSLHDLAAHMLGELSWTPDLVQGKTIAEVGNAHEGDLIGNDLQAAWRQAAEAALAAVSQADPNATIHLSYGDSTVEAYLQEAASDQAIHAWDMAAALQDSLRYDPTMAQQLYDLVQAKQDKLQASGLFAAPVKVPAESNVQMKLLALYGRDANWQPPA